MKNTIVKTIATLAVAASGVVACGGEAAPVPPADVVTAVQSFVQFSYHCDDGTEFRTASTNDDTMNVYTFDFDLPLDEWTPFTDGDLWFHDEACGV